MFSSRNNAHKIDVLFVLASACNWTHKRERSLFIFHSIWCVLSGIHLWNLFRVKLKTTCCIALVVNLHKFFFDSKSKQHATTHAFLKHEKFVYEFRISFLVQYLADSEHLSKWDDHLQCSHWSRYTNSNFLFKKKRNRKLQRYFYMQTVTKRNAIAWISVWKSNRL